MMNEKKATDNSGSNGEADLEKPLEEHDKLGAPFKERFTGNLTVMFAELKVSSTSIAENEGDSINRMRVKHHDEIVVPAIKENNGVFVKFIGDAALSCFESALEAARTAVRIQQGMDALNMSKKFKSPVLMRIGMHFGECEVEKSDISSDVVNTASRFKSVANPGEIFMSEECYSALSDKSEIYCRFAKQVAQKGGKAPFNAYKAFWKPGEIELDRHEKVLPSQAPQTAASTSGINLVGFVAGIIGLMLLLTFGVKFFSSSHPVEARHSINHSVESPNASR
jgi:class 3 adenylate cyclase